MRIRILSQIQDARQAKNEMLKAQTHLIRERTNAIQDMKKSAQESMKAMVETASKPTMSLSNELYGGATGYTLDTWGMNHTNARRLSRIAHGQSPAAQSLIGRFTDLVYGPRLELQSSPLWDLIPNSPPDNEAGNEARQKIIKNIEQRWRLFAKSKKSDYTQNKNHYQRSRSNFEKLLLDGEYFILCRYSQSRKRNPLTTQYIAPENIQRTSSSVVGDNKEIDGIEYDSKGIAVAYHIYSPSTGKSTRVLKEGPKSGRTFVIHNKLGDGLRGVGLLVGIITELTKLSDFQALEIQAAVINAIFAVWVETEIGGETKSVVDKAGITRSTGPTTTNVREPWNGAEFAAQLNGTEFTQGGVIAQNLGEGQKLHSFDTKRPTANFEQFYKTVSRSLFAAKGMSEDVAHFDPQSSYSAIRTNLLILWNKIMTLRFDHSNDYEDVIYRMWLWGEIDNGNIDINVNYQDEFIQDAFSNATWTGPARPDIDPQKSANAHEMESKNGWKTDSQIASERGGGDFDENIQRKISENEIKALANEPIVKQEKTSYSFSENKTESESVSKTEE